MKFTSILVEDALVPPYLNRDWVITHHVNRIRIRIYISSYGENVECLVV